jgi:hypothetical protein
VLHPKDDERRTPDLEHGSRLCCEQHSETQAACYNSDAGFEGRSGVVPPLWVWFGLHPVSGLVSIPRLYSKSRKNSTAVLTWLVCICGVDKGNDGEITTS